MAGTREEAMSSHPQKQQARGLVPLFAGLRCPHCALGTGRKPAQGDKDLFIRSRRLGHGIATVNTLWMARSKQPPRPLKDLKSENLQ